MYYTYMLRCTDGSIYTGIAADVSRRMKEHFTKDKRCAKYTRWHTAQKLEAIWQSEDRAAASRLEYRIKRLSREQKEQLIAENAMEQLLGNVLFVGEYRRVTLSIVGAEEL
ncbi:MAG: GIY-YIG nuclease family protein [Eubacteriales bacterium]|nr:GIY-YIG nuclease family protein [Eubacteriales bacterium]